MKTKMIHGTCIQWLGAGILFLGESGSGKSDLALRCIEKGALLVADDQVVLSDEKSFLSAAAPEKLAGLIEIRGIGIVSLSYVGSSPLSFVVYLKPAAQIERLPEEKQEIFLEHSVMSYDVTPYEASAPLKIYYLLQKFLSLQE